MVAAFISALLLSLLCGLFYNAWKYEVERIEREEGSWQSRITGEFSTEAIEAIKNFAGIKDAVINEKELQGQETVIDLYFNDWGRVLTDTPRIAEQVGASKEAVTYHHMLLSMYLVRDPQDTAPRLLFPMFMLIVAMASFSLIVIIHNSFAVSMNARIHQFGIFSVSEPRPDRYGPACYRKRRRCALRRSFLGIFWAFGAAKDLYGW